MIQPQQPPDMETAQVHLPPQLTRFIGRERELARIGALLRDHSLITLTGPAGTGKTRLAIEAAQRAAAMFPGGVWFVPLSPVADPELLPAVIAAVLGVRDAAGESLEARLLQFLGGRTSLLVLDSTEHLLAAAPAVEELLHAAPDLTILVTSRAPFGLASELVHLVPPLDTPDPAHLPPPAELTSHEAIALFTDRARLAKTDFRIDETNAQAVAEICRQVDALPLAIELAASRIGMFPPDVLLGQLSHSLETLSRGGRVRPGRQQTLAGAIDWSYRLLGEQEQVLLARLSVLRGAWSARAAEAVSGNGVVLDVPGGLASLVAQSLLRSSSEDEGFSMLKTIRQFAAQKLTERGEEPETGERHARYFTDLAARAEPLIRGKDQAQWLRWLELSIDNFRAAMSWLLEHGRIEEELHLAADLYGFWFRRGHWSEGLRWLESGLERAEHVAAPVRIRALQAAGDLSNWLGRYDRAAAALREGLALAQETGDVIGSARALRTLSTIARWQDNLDTAESFARQSLAMYEQTDDLAGRALATNALGVVAYQQQDYARARELVSAALASWRTVGDTFSVVWALNNLGVLAMEQDDPAEARDRLLEALALGRDISAPSGTVLCLANLGDLSVRLGEYRQAAGFLQEGIRLAYELGYTSNLLNLLTYTVEWLAALDRARAVASLSGAIIARREALGQPVSRADRPRWEQVLESAEARLGDERFHADQDAGRALGLDEAAHFALRELETLLPET